MPVIAAAADGVHSRRSKNTEIRRLVTSGAFLDDCIAIRGFYYPITATSGNVITVTAGGGGEFKVNDPVRIVNTDGTFLKDIICNAMENVAGTDNYKLTLSKTLSIPSGSYACNPVYNGSGFKVIDCEVGNTRSRAIITKGDNGLISGTKITHAVIGIAIGPEINSQWQEAGYSLGVTVTGNTIDDCYSGINLLSLGAYGNEDLTISNNVFGTMTSGAAIDLYGCKNVTISGNYFDVLTNANAITLDKVTGITLANNLVEYVSGGQNRISRNTSTVFALTGLNNGLIYTGRNYTLTNTLGGFLLPATTYEWGGGGYHQLRSATTGQALGVGTSASAGGAVGWETPSGSDGQLWRMSPYGTADADTTFTLVNKLSGLSVTVSGGQLVQQAAAIGSTGQVWTPSVLSSGYVYATWATSTGAGTTVTADDDGDGLANLLEYALATPPLVAGTGPMVATSSLTVNGTTAIYLTITFTRRVAASDVTLEVQYSSDLSTWAGSAVLVSSAPASDGTTTETWRAPTPVGTAARDFLRVRVTK